MLSHIITQHKNSQLSIHLYIELSPSLTKSTYRWNSNHLKQALQKNGHVKKDINKKINKHTSKAMNPNTQSQ